MQDLETQSSTITKAKKVTRITTYIATCAWAILGLLYAGYVLIYPFFCDEYHKCLEVVYANAGIFLGFLIVVILLINVFILLVSFGVGRFFHKPEVVLANHSDFDDATFQPFISSDPQDFVPPSRFYTAARIVMYIYFAVLALIGICFSGYIVYSVIYCSFDFDCSWQQTEFYFALFFGPAICIDAAVFPPLAVLLFLVSKFARKSKAVGFQEIEYDQAFGDQGYASTSVNSKGFVTL